jgi:hypothetical protein
VAAVVGDHPALVRHRGLLAVHIDGAPIVVDTVAITVGGGSVGRGAVDAALPASGSAAAVPQLPLSLALMTGKQEVARLCATALTQAMLVLQHLKDVRH